MHLPERLRKHAGWCPHNANGAPLKRSLREEIPMERDSGMGKSPSPLAPEKNARKIPSQILTGTAILILFLTIFFGGNWWWPVLTAGVTGVFLVLLYYGYIDNPLGRSNVFQ